MPYFPQQLLDKLDGRSESGSLRQLQIITGMADFSSNDYLGLSQSQSLLSGAHQYLIDNDLIKNGATGSRLISGHHGLYDLAEDKIAAFHNSEAALIFNSGYDANVGFFSSVPQKGDIVLYDEYIHASIRDGIRLSNAKAYKFRHNRIDDLERLLISNEQGEGYIYVATESVFSMDGESPDLETMVQLCNNYNAMLVVDEAHALGVFGTKGEGLVQELGLQQDVFARIITFGKALGCHGAAVLGPIRLREYLINFARSFIYTTALPPHSVSAILLGYNHLDTDDTARDELKNIISFFRNEVTRCDLNQSFSDSTSAIHCAIVPGNAHAKKISSFLRSNGFDVRAILAPTVPEGKERLRFCLHSFNTEQQVADVLVIFKRALAQL